MTFCEGVNRNSMIDRFQTNDSCNTRIEDLRLYMLFYKKS